MAQKFPLKWHQVRHASEVKTTFCQLQVPDKLFKLEQIYLAELIDTAHILSFIMNPDSVENLSDVTRRVYILLHWNIKNPCCNSLNLPITQLSLQSTNIIFDGLDSATLVELGDSYMHWPGLSSIQIFAALFPLHFFIYCIIDCLSKLPWVPPIYL